MTKDKRNMSDDEYQFPEEEYVTAEQPDHDQQSVDGTEAEQIDSESANGQPSRVDAFKEMFGKVPLFRNKRVLIVLGVAVVALVGFKIMSGGHTKVIKKEQPKPVQTQQPQIVQSQASPQVMGQLSSLQQSQEKSQSDLNQTQQEVQSLQNALAQSAQNQEVMNHNMAALVNQVKQLTAEVKKEQQPKKKSEKKMPPQPKIVYHLKAIIPGRAWIMSNHGASTTVAVGDHLKQYGRVIAVQAQRGDVLTSSGKVIAYGPYDD